MLDGVGWAAAEIVIFMLIATLIGLGIGWIFGRWLQKGTIAEGYEAELAAQRELTKKAESRLSESNKNLDKVHLDLKGERAKVGDLASAVEVAAVAAGGQEAKLSATGDLDAELSKLRGDLAACGTERDGLADRLAQLEGIIGSRDEKISRLAAELSAVSEPVVEPVGVTPSAAAVQAVAAGGAKSEPTKEEGLAKIVEIAARTVGGGPAADDDLKKVHGIGPKLEQTLKGLGITSFRQIASLQTEDVAFVTAALDAFKGRIERDDWMSSAAEQHTKKYNEPA